MRTKTLAVTSLALIIPTLALWFFGQIGRIGDGGYRSVPEYMTRTAMLLGIIQFYLVATVFTRRAIEKFINTSEVLLLISLLTGFISAFFTIKIFARVVKDASRVNFVHVMRNQGGAIFITLCFLALVVLPIYTYIYARLYKKQLDAIGGGAT